MIKGMTALMYAAQGGHIDLIDLLLRSGADENRRDKVCLLYSIYCFMIIYLYTFCICRTAKLL